LISKALKETCDVFYETNWGRTKGFLCAIIWFSPPKILRAMVIYQSWLLDFLRTMVIKPFRLCSCF
jgi:hypothetical protein